MNPPPGAPQAWLATVLAALLLAGCGSGSGGGEAGAGTAGASIGDPCSTGNQRAWLREYMGDQYFWYANLGVPDERAPDIGAYFQSLLYRPVDRYSGSQPTAEYSQFFGEGMRTGYGYTLVWSDASQTSLRVRFAEPHSPVGLAGLKRGDTVLTIDGYGPVQIASGTPGSVSDEGIARSFRVVDTAGVERSFTVASATYPVSAVPAAVIVPIAADSGPVNAGYFLFQSFLPAGEGALGRAFSDFASAGVRELILDLRYNSGGLVSVARNLASMIGGSGLEGKKFAEFRFNAKHPENNFSYAFTADPAQLPAAPLSGLNRVIVITSPATASASELVINALTPFLDVVLIGGTTFGKPYASQPRDSCGTTFSAVNFEYVNALGEGGFTGGFAPRCSVIDDLDHQLGDPGEARLAAAIEYIGTGACPAGTTGQLAQLRGLLPGREAVFGETAPRQLVLD